MKIGLSIIDYLQKARPDYKAPAQNFQKKEQENFGVGKFDEILQATRFNDKTSGKSIHKALTISDYLAKPVRVRSNGISRSLENTISSLKSTKANIPFDIGEGSLNPNHVEEHPPENNNPSSIQLKLQQKTPKKNVDETAIRQKIDNQIELAAKKYDIPSKLIRGVIKAESDFQHDAISPAGAQGLMQLMPGTAKELGVMDSMNIEQNIDGGVRYLKKMMDQFNGDVKLSLAAYNSGPGTVRRYQGIPPYKETIQYVERVLKYSTESV